MIRRFIFKIGKIAYRFAVTFLTYGMPGHGPGPDKK